MSETGKVIGFAHIGCIVPNRDEALRFFEQVVGIQKSKKHHIHFEANSRIMGIPNSVMNIGFARQRDEDIILEAIEYSSHNFEAIVNDPTVLGASTISFLVPSVDEVKARCQRPDIRILNESEAIAEGPFAGRKQLVLRYNNLLNLEFIQDSHSTATPRLAKISYMVSSIEQQAAFFEGLGFSVSQRYMAQFADVGPYPGAALNNGRDDFVIEFLENDQTQLCKVDIQTGTLGLGHLCLHIDGIETLYEQLKKEGIQFTDRPVTLKAGLNTGAKATYLTAPDGLKVELYEGRLLRMDG